MLKYMLDTNIVIYTMKQRPIEVKEKFASQLVTLPMNSEHIRSLNLANAATAAAYEALRQIDFT